MIAAAQVSGWTIDEQLEPALGPWRLAFDLWPQEQARRWRALLAAGQGEALALLVDRPADRLLVQLVQERLRRPVRWQQCPSQVIDQGLGSGAADYRALADIESGGEQPSATPMLEDLETLMRSDSPGGVVRLLGAMLHDALQEGASDIHIECTAAGAEIRLRIDGVMAAVRSVAGRQLADQLVSRLKVMADLDIGERRTPQDGRFRLRVAARESDFRLSIMPSSFGEDAVVRLLDRSRADARSGPPTLASLGLDAQQRKSMLELARMPHGLLLVTGPTGSGKTTTLYATLAEIRTGQEKIITIEDPVEVQLPGIVQIPVNEKKGLTFARGLRSILRHDPDRVMVGEIRDAETAQIVVQAALTGHLVLSTVHANNPYDVIGRLMHMGLDLYHVVSALNAVLAQRLLRVNCPHCVQRTQAEDSLVAEFRLEAGQTEYWRGSGCGHCRGTGYRGRRAVAALLRMDDGLRDLIASRAPLSTIKQAAQERGLKSLRESAVDWVREGHTTYEEVQRVTLAE